jgi:hypothetical protein
LHDGSGRLFPIALGAITKNFIPRIKLQGLPRGASL